MIGPRSGGRSRREGIRDQVLEDWCRQPGGLDPVPPVQASLHSPSPPCLLELLPSIPRDFGGRSEETSLGPVPPLYQHVSCCLLVGLVEVIMCSSSSAGNGFGGGGGSCSSSIVAAIKVTAIAASRHHRDDGYIKAMGLLPPLLTDYHMVHGCWDRNTGRGTTGMTTAESLADLVLGHKVQKKLMPSLEDSPIQQERRVKHSIFKKFACEWASHTHTHTHTHTHPTP